MQYFPSTIACCTPGRVQYSRESVNYNYTAVELYGTVQSTWYQSWKSFSSITSPSKGESIPSQSHKSTCTVLITGQNRNTSESRRTHSKSAHRKGKLQPHRGLTTTGPTGQVKHDDGSTSRRSSAMAVADISPPPPPLWPAWEGCLCRRPSPLIVNLPSSRQLAFSSFPAVEG